ncbi:MAG: anti-sigma factor [Thermomicrobiales bacterium]|nr:anti-sigma factor [Thermomicrobiales bacterium]
MTESGSSSRAIAWPLVALLAVVSLLGGVWLGAVAFVADEKPSPRMVPIQVLDDTLKAGGNVEYIPDREIYVLSLQRIPPPPEGSSYQIWFGNDDVIVSAGLWNPTATRFAVVAYESRYDTMFITLEPSPRGSDQPTTEPLIEIDLTAL